MKSFVRTTLIILLTGILVGSCFMIAKSLWGYKEGADTYSEAEATVGIDDDLPVLEIPPHVISSDPTDTSTEEETEEDTYVDPYAKYLDHCDFKSLQKVNSDIIGWIVVPGTKLSYPLLQARDNDFYLTHLYTKRSCSVGAIFMDYKVPSDLSGYNTIIYGHRMKDGSMFASLKYYLNSSYCEEHPCIYITNEAGVYQYTVFAAYEGSPTGASYSYSFGTDDFKQKFVNYAKKHAKYKTGITDDVTIANTFLTLSTCTGNGHSKRMLVQAVLTSFTPN